MEFLPYDRVDPEQVRRLNLLGLGYYLGPERVARMRRLDPRFGGDFALYAVEDGQVLAQTGLLEVTLRTVAGEEKAGALWAVCTLPGHARRGVARALLTEAHRIFTERGYRFSFLTTSRSLVAHHLYRDLGYRDLAPMATAFAPASLKPPDDSWSLTSPGLTPEVAGTAWNIWRDAFRGRLGFVRPRAFLAAAEAGGDLEPQGIRLISRRGQPVGYAFVRSGPAQVRVLELAAPAGVYRDAVLALAGEGPLVMTGLVEGPEVGALRALGFAVLESYGRLMVCCLGGSSEPTLQVEQLLGVEQGRLWLGQLDHT